MDFGIKGKPPVYVGFASNPIAETGQFKMIFEKVRNDTNQSPIISKEWADLQKSNSSDI